MTKHTITPADIRKYNDGKSGKVDEIWWEIMHELPKHLFQEALRKGFELKSLDDQDPNKVAIEAIGATPELATAVRELFSKIVK